MDLHQLRADVGAVGRAAGFNAWSYEPDDPQNLPALVVGGVKSLIRKTMSGICELEIDITLYVNAANPEDAAARLDLALSLGMADSFLSYMEAVDPQAGPPESRPAWRSARFIAAGSYQRVTMPGGGEAATVNITYSFTA